MNIPQPDRYELANGNILHVEIVEVGRGEWRAEARAFPSAPDKPLNLLAGECVDLDGTRAMIEWVKTETDVHRVAEGYIAGRCIATVSLVGPA